MERQIVDALINKENARYKTKWLGFLSMRYQNTQVKVSNFHFLSLSSLINEMKKTAFYAFEQGALVSKFDIACDYQELSLINWNQQILHTKEEHYQRGILFDRKEQTALLGQELNHQKILQYGQKEICLHLENLNRYLIQTGKIVQPLHLGGETLVTTFDTYSWLYDIRDISASFNQENP
ncbi:hypothetical protein [Listeria ilorinensis]|uniref:hypothetical protein n=1 Tax=Listeria ilorinensis TaxID=2867439 RepID=UPI001EF66620|nr:hypothetical protein [Listeria ilorinensis]